MIMRTPFCVRYNKNNINKKVLQKLNLQSTLVSEL